MSAQNNFKIAVFGGGCFWCTEAVFKELRGVHSVMPGYAGGKNNDPEASPTYEAVCAGNTGHAEVIRIEFDPHEISYQNLLTVFFATHDSTTLNQQGNDVGTQYRSIILYTNENQKRESEHMISEIENSNDHGGHVVTEVVPLQIFYPAETYHQDYYRNNPENSYCQLIINPKLKKVQDQFSKFLRDQT